MKILLFTAAFHKHGAVSKYAVELASRFVEEHEVHVLTSRYIYKIEGLHVHCYPIMWWPYYMQVGLNAVKNTLMARRLDRKYGFDIIHSQGGESLYQNIIKAPSCHKAAVEKFKEERGPGYRILKTLEPASNIVLTIEWYNYAKRNFKKAIVLSKGTYTELQRYYGVPDEYLALIPNGVDIDEFTPLNRDRYREETRDRHGLIEEDKVMLFVGWEFKRKGLKYVIESLPYIEDDVKLLVVGGDKRSNYLRHASDLGVRDRVIFAGQSTDVKRYYASADLFVMPTDYESFSMATLEAVSSGLPILATKVNGTEDLIVEGKNGFFIERDGRDIAEKTQKLLSGNKLEKMSAKARESAKPYSWDNIAEETLKLYREVLA